MELKQTFRFGSFRYCLWNRGKNNFDVCVSGRDRTGDLARVKRT